MSRSFGSIGIAIYRSAMAGGVPDGVPLEAAEAARDALGGAVEVAGQLPGRLGPELIDAAREAFIQRLHLAAAISAVGAIGLAIFVAVLLRRVRASSEPERPPDLEPDSARESGAPPTPAPAEGLSWEPASPSWP